MMQPHLPELVPDYFYAEVSTLLAIFKTIESESAAIKVDAKVLFNLLPLSLKRAPVFFDGMSKIWRYEYGKIFDGLPNDLIAVGTYQWPPVEQLCLGLLAAKIHLSNSDMGKIVDRLGDRAKHRDFLAELAPLAKLSQSCSATYEIENYGSGNRTIDWYFEKEDKVPILIDVKNRLKDLIGQMKQASEGKVNEQGILAEPNLNPEALFKDTVEKFRSRSEKEILQGVWIHSPIKQDRKELTDYFKSLDRDRLHFAIFNSWSEDATILVRSDEVKNHLLNYFSLTESDHIFYDKNAE